MPDPFVVLDAGALDAAGEGATVPLPRDADRHLRTVLRLSPGAPLLLADGAGASAPAQLAEDGARLTGEVELEPAPEVTIEVLQGLPKGRKLDEVVRVLTELGVDRLTPVAAERSVTRLEGAKVDKAVERWRAVARAAAEQSRRARTLVVDPPVGLDQLPVADEGGGALLLVAHVGAERGLRDVLRDLDGVARVVVAVGPEGGWTDAEVARLTAVGGHLASLGRSVLRTEHAAPALAAVVSFTLGRMG